MKKISIISSMGIGDIITSGPLVKKLKTVYPQSKITIYSLRGGYLADLKIYYVDEIIKLDSFEKFFKFFREEADILISLGYYSKISGYLKILLYYLMIFLSRSKKKIFYGELESFEFKNKNMVQIKLDILKKLNIEIKDSDYNLFLPFSFEKEKKKINKTLRENKIEGSDLLAIFHVGIKRGYFTRFWPVKRWIHVVNYVAREHTAKIVFLGGEEDVRVTKEIINNLNFSVLNLTGKLSIKETTALINECNLFISTNSGPMWVAAALKKPQIALCGPSKFAWEPFIKKAIVLRKVINRKHCNPPCDAKKCKYKDSLCMKSIKVEEVIGAIEQQMKNVKNN